jgi:hypothetical protein
LTQKPIGRQKLGKGPSGTLVKLDYEAHHKHMGKNGQKMKNNENNINDVNVICNK